MLILLGVFLCVAGFEDAIIGFIVLTISVMLGYPCALISKKNWRDALLENGEIQRRDSTAASQQVETAEAVVLEEGGGGRATLPVAVAVPIQPVGLSTPRTRGPVSTRADPSRRISLPDPLAETIVRESQKLLFGTLLHEINNFRSGEWDLRASYVDLAAKHWALKKLKSLSNCPDTATGNLFKGAYYIHRSWDVRGSNMAHTVSDSNGLAFLRGLEKAMNALLRSASQDPEDPTPYALLAGPVAKGLQVPNQQALEWFQAAIARDPEHFSAHCGRLNLVCKKWGGSHEAMFAFSIISPTVIRYQAFYEQWLWLKHFERNEAAANQYRNDPDVIEETMDIYRSCIENRPVLNLADVERHSMAVQWLCLCTKEETQAEIQKLSPWKSALSGQVLRLVEIADHLEEARGTRANGRIHY